MGTRSWCFTLNNPTEDETEFITDRLQVLATCLYVSLEEGEEGTPHYQGYVSLRRTKRLAGMKKLMPRAHFEPAKGDKNDNYCYIFKVDSEPVVKFDNGAQGKRTDITDFLENWSESGKRAAVQGDPTTYVKFHKGLEKAHQILNVDHREAYPVCVWLHGPTGIQKTWAGVEKAQSIGGEYCNVSDLPWFHGYQQQEVLIIDEIDKGDNGLPIKMLLQIMDRYHYHVPVKGSYEIFNSPYVFITSTNHPRNLMKEDDWPQVLRRLAHLGTRMSVDEEWEWEKGDGNF